MGKADRKRWEGNVKSMEIIAKPLDKITEDDLVFYAKIIRQRAVYCQTRTQAALSLRQHT